MVTICEIIENQKKRLRELTFYDIIRVAPGYIKVYVGYTFIAYGIHMYDAGEYFPLITMDPKTASLLITVLIGVIMAR
jgi:hypothetical protein